MLLLRVDDLRGGNTFDPCSNSSILIILLISNK